MKRLSSITGLFERRKSDVSATDAAVAANGAAGGGVGDASGGGAGATLDEGGEVDVWMAARRGHLDLLQSLIEEGGVEVDVEDAKGKTPLQHAAEGGMTKAIQWLLSKHADPNHGDRLDKTPVHAAAEKGIVRELEQLRDNGGDIRKTDLHGYTPLHWAAGKGHHGAVIWLTSNGAAGDINVQDKNGYTPLHWACNGLHQHCVTVLVTRGADVKIKNRNGLTPRKLASQMTGCSEVVNFLNECERKQRQIERERLARQMNLPLEGETFGAAGGDPFDDSDMPPPLADTADEDALGGAGNTDDGGGHYDFA